MWTLEVGEGTMGILHHRGFREAFLENVMTEESGGAKNKSIPGMQWGSSPRFCDDCISEASEACWGGARGRAYWEKRCPGKAKFPPYYVTSFIYHITYLFIHSLICSTNNFYVPDTAPCPRDKIILKEYHFPPQPTPWQGDR